MLYLTRRLAYTDDQATILFHIFASLVYFFPLVGAIIADSWLGRFKWVIAVTFVYAGLLFHFYFSFFPPQNNILYFHCVCSRKYSDFGGCDTDIAFTSYCGNSAWFAAYSDWNWGNKAMCFGFWRRSIQTAGAAEGVGEIFLRFLSGDKCRLIDFDYVDTDFTWRCSLFWRERVLFAGVWRSWSAYDRLIRFV